MLSNEGRLAYPGPSHWNVCLTDTLTWDGYQPGSWGTYYPLCWNLVEHFCVLAVGEVMWVTCWWLSLYAIRDLRIRHGRCDCSLRPVASRLVVLFEGHDLCYSCNREKLSWNLWDRGTRRLSWRTEIASMVCYTWTLSLASSGSSTIIMNS